MLWPTKIGRSKRGQRQDNNSRWSCFVWFPHTLKNHAFPIAMYMLLMSCCRSGFVYGTTVSPAVSSNKLQSHAIASQDVILVDVEFRRDIGIPLNIRPHIDAAVRFVKPIDSDLSPWAELKKQRFCVTMSSKVAMIESETGASLPKLCRAATWSAHTWRCSEIFGWFLPRFGPKQLGVTCFGEKLKLVHRFRSFTSLTLAFAYKSCHIPPFPLHVTVTGRSADCMCMCTHWWCSRCI